MRQQRPATQASNGLYSRGNSRSSMVLISCQIGENFGVPKQFMGEKVALDFARVKWNLTLLYKKRKRREWVNIVTFPPYFPVSWSVNKTSLSGIAVQACVCMMHARMQNFTDMIFADIMSLSSRETIIILSRMSHWKWMDERGRA